MPLPEVKQSTTMFFPNFKTFCCWNERLYQTFYCKTSLFGWQLDPPQNQKTSENFCLFQAKNDDFDVDFLDDIDKFRQGTGDVWRYGGALSDEPIWVSLGFVFAEKRAVEKKHTALWT